MNDVILSLPPEELTAVELAFVMAVMAHVSELTRVLGVDKTKVQVHLQSEKLLVASLRDS
jgi:hypothetical protein